MKTKQLILILMLFSCARMHVQEKFDYKVCNNTSAIVVYKIMYDSLQKLTILSGTNIYYKNKYYPLANNDRSITFMQRVVIPNEPVLAPECDTIVSLLESADPKDFTSSSLFSDSMIEGDTSRYVHYIGGEQFTKFEKYGDNKAMRLMCFYVAFKFTADLLFVWEGNEEPFYMRRWACLDSYDYTNGSSDPTIFLLKLKSSKKLTKKEQKTLGLIPMPKFGYDFYYCN